MNSAVPGNRPGRLPRDELPEDPPGDLGLVLVDPPAAMDRVATGIMLADDVGKIMKPVLPVSRFAMAHSQWYGAEDAPNATQEAGARRVQRSY